MDDWDSSRIEIIENKNGNSSISLSGYYDNGSNGINYESNYTGDINENGEIVGKIPAYVKKVGTEEFLPVTSLEYAFIGRTDLIKAPEIPSSVTDMSYTFYGCASLEQAPEIPDSVTDMGYTFYGCTSLEQAPVISDSVTNMYGTFYDCTSLIQAPEIPDSVTSMGYTFYGCTRLEQAPEIPSSVVLMNGTFYGCKRLKQASEIPSSVTNLNDIFYGCTNLTGKFVINAVPSYPANCKNCLTNAATNDNCNLVLSGTCPLLAEIYATRSDGAHITCPQIDNVSTGE